VSTSAKQAPRIIAVLKLPRYRVPLLLARVRMIVERMTGNTWFPTPVPALGIIQAAIDDVDDAQTTTLTRLKDSVAARDEKRVVLLSRLESLRGYVQAIANANPEHAGSIIESAGMYVKNVRGPAGRVFSAKQRKSEEVELSVPSAGDRAAYEFQYGLDGGKTWLSLPDPFTTRTTATVKGLTPGSTVHFRYRASVKGVTGDWSNVIAIIVS
jgi:hypothetical protein